MFVYFYKSYKIKIKNNKQNIYIYMLIDKVIIVLNVGLV